MGIKFRLPRADEIELRAGSISENGLSLLLYQDARVGMNILDETVGAGNWQRRHEVIGGNLFCNVGINIYYDQPEREPLFIWKQDVGVESFTEKEKGQASDSFKRAVVNWGVCRCLYSAPFIWITPEQATIKPDKKGKLQCKDGFFVEKILYNDRDEIVALSIKNSKTKERVFVMDRRKKVE